MNFIINVIKKYNKPLSIKFFNNTNVFIYNLFNFFYKKTIFTRKNLNLIKDFIDNGYQKLDSIPEDTINKINALIKKQSPNNLHNPLFRYEINSEIENIVKGMIKDNFPKVINEIEECYRASMKLSYVRINRNHGYEDDKERFSNYFHTDGYVFTLIKFFINLHEVTEKHGPLELIDQKSAKKFLKNNYKTNEFRIFLDKDNNETGAFKNTGKKGSVLIARTPELLHRATKPRLHFFRDMLFLEFVLIPKELENNNIFSICEHTPEYLSKLHNPISQNISKIKGIRNTIKTFFKYKKASNN